MSEHALFIAAEGEGMFMHPTFIAAMRDDFVAHYRSAPLVDEWVCMWLAI